MFSLIENAKLVSVMSPIDKTGAVLTTEWISLKQAKEIFFLVDLGVMSSTSNQAVTLYVANNASGTKNKAITSASAACGLTLPAVWKRASGGDTLARQAVSSSTFNLTKSSDGCTFIIPVDCNKAGTFISSSVVYNAEYVRLSIATPGAHACLYNCLAILTGLRYQEDVPPTAIT